jgi:hypothetical protein
MWQYFSFGSEMKHMCLKGDGGQKGAQFAENTAEPIATKCSPLSVGDPRFTVMSNNTVEVTLKTGEANG